MHGPPLSGKNQLDTSTIDLETTGLGPCLTQGLPRIAHTSSARTPDGRGQSDGAKTSQHNISARIGACCFGQVGTAAKARLQSVSVPATVAQLAFAEPVGLRHEFAGVGEASP
jgi:hypothetical protein